MAELNSKFPGGTGSTEAIHFETQPQALTQDKVKHGDEALKFIGVQRVEVTPEDVSENLVSHSIGRTDIMPFSWTMGLSRTLAFAARQTCIFSSSSSSPTSGRSTTRPSGATATCLACQ
jgi:hypothetical protein